MDFDWMMEQPHKVREVTLGEIACTNEAMGGDPAHGVHKKCFCEEIDPNMRRRFAGGITERLLDMVKAGEETASAAPAPASTGEAPETAELAPAPAAPLN